MKRVYICGGIGGRPFEDAQADRRHTADLLWAAGFQPVDPMRGKVKGANYLPGEIIGRDLQDIKTCDLVLADLNGERLCGTFMELAYAKTWGIPVVAYADGGAWPRDAYWAQGHVLRWFYDKHAAIGYLNDFWGGE